jgi:hypothetical protein
MFGGIGINLVSHVLVNHLSDAEKKFKVTHPDANPPYMDSPPKSRN